MAFLTFWFVVSWWGGRWEWKGKKCNWPNCVSGNWWGLNHILGDYKINQAERWQRLRLGGYASEAGKNMDDSKKYLGDKIIGISVRFFQGEGI